MTKKGKLLYMWICRVGPVTINNPWYTGMCSVQSWNLHKQGILWVEAIPAHSSYNHANVGLGVLYQSFWCLDQGSVPLLSMQKALVDISNTLYMYTVTREIFVVKILSYSSKITKIKHTKYFQHTYYVIECELYYCRVQKFFNTNILHTYF